MAVERLTEVGMIKKGVFDTWHVKIHHDRGDLALVKAMKSWCFETIDLNDPRVSYHCRRYSFTFESFPTSVNFVFDREKDAVLFALRWS
jgi:hypothetical protein